MSGFHLSVAKLLVLHYYATQLAQNTYVTIKPKPIMTHLHAFSRASRQLKEFTSSFDWCTGLSAIPLFVIGQSGYFGFGFTTLS